MKINVLIHYTTRYHLAAGNRYSRHVDWNSGMYTEKIEEVNRLVLILYTTRYHLAAGNRYSSHVDWNFRDVR